MSFDSRHYYIIRSFIFLCSLFSCLFLWPTTIERVWTYGIPGKLQRRLCQGHLVTIVLSVCNYTFNVVVGFGEGEFVSGSSITPSFPEIRMGWVKKKEDLRTVFTPFVSLRTSTIEKTELDLWLSVHCSVPDGPQVSKFLVQTLL